MTIKFNEIAAAPWKARADEVDAAWFVARNAESEEEADDENE